MNCTFVLYLHNATFIIEIIAVLLDISTDPPHPFMEGALMMTEVDDFDPECAHDRPWSTPVLGIDRFCLTWNADEHFARDQIGAFGDKNNVTVKVTVHYMSSESSLDNHGMESGWKTINLDEFSVESIKDSLSFVNPDAFEGRPLLKDNAAVINLQLNVLDLQEVSNPVPVLFFLKVSVIGTAIDMFTSSPLLSFIPKDTQQLRPMTATQCTNIIPKLDEVVVNRLPCPATMRQAFLDPSLVVDSGCLVNPSTPNKAFNCHLNPNATQCFLQRLAQCPCRHGVFSMLPSPLILICTNTHAYMGAHFKLPMVGTPIILVRRPINPGLIKDLLDHVITSKVL